MAEWDDLTKKQFAAFEEMGEAQVRAALANNTLGTTRRAFARRWLAEIEVQQNAAASDAMEKGQSTAQESLAAAKSAVRWSVISTLIAFAALLLAAWPYITQHLEH